MKTSQIAKPQSLKTTLAATRNTLLDAIRQGGDVERASADFSRALRDYRWFLLSQIPLTHSRYQNHAEEGRVL